MIAPLPKYLTYSVGDASNQCFGVAARERDHGTRRADYRHHRSRQEGDSGQQGRGAGDGRKERGEGQGHTTKGAWGGISGFYIDSPSVWCTPCCVLWPGYEPQRSIPCYDMGSFVMTPQPSSLLPSLKQKRQQSTPPGKNKSKMVSYMRN